MPSDPFETLEAVAAVVPPSRWMLVGGVMVHCHAVRSGVTHARPTYDADMVVEISASSYGDAARGVQSIGFALQEPLDDHAPVHRFVRSDGSVVDLMAPDRQSRPSVYRGRTVIDVPGSAFAMKRTIPHALSTGTTIRLPDLASALALKSWAYFLPAAQRERHLQDAVTLLVCIDRNEAVLSKSMKSAVRRMLGAISAQEVAWQMCDPDDWARATRAARGIDSKWAVPELIRPQRPGRRQG